MSFYLTLPNLLTLSRLGAAPVIGGILIAQPPAFSVALWLFAWASLSDFLDGFLARTWKQESVWGAWLDPLADKVLLTLVFGALAWIDVIPFSLALLVVLRDVLIVLGVWGLKRNEKTLTIQPLWISKLNTVFQMILICLGLSIGAWGKKNAVIDLLFQVGVVLTFFTTLLSGLAYGYLGWRLWKTPVSSI